jgi:hypothetical protein
MKIYRVLDGDVLRATALSKCFKVDSGSNNIVLSVEDLTSFVHDTARGSFQVILPRGAKTVTGVKLPMSAILRDLGQEYAPLLKLLVERPDAKTTIFPLSLPGAAPN